MPLTHFDIRNTKPADKPFKLSDGGGLFLRVQPNGSMPWRLEYRFVGKERALSFGADPTVSLADARRKRDEAKKLLDKGKDPSSEKRTERLARELAARNTFGLIAEEYIENLKGNGMAEITVEKNRWLLQDLAKPLANRPIAEITPAELLDLLKRVEKSGRRETARRLRGVMGSVFRLAVVTLRATTDPTFALKGALLRPNVKPRSAITDEKKLGGPLRAIDEFDGWPTLRAALKFCALTFAVPARFAERRDTHTVMLA